MSAASRLAIAEIDEKDAPPSFADGKHPGAAHREAGDGVNTTIALGPLGTSLGFHLRLAQIRAFEDFFSTFAEDGLQPGAFSVLITIGENPGIRQGILAAALMIKRSHMAKIVQSFGEAGLVSRHVPADDRRAVELTLTEAGRQRVDTVMPKFLAHEKASASCLSESERQTLFSLLRKLGGL